jgi:hypothetical protein
MKGREAQRRCIDWWDAAMIQLGGHANVFDAPPLVGFERLRQSRCGSLRLPQCHRKRSASVFTID